MTRCSTPRRGLGQLLGQVTCVALVVAVWLQSVACVGVKKAELTPDDQEFRSRTDTLAAAYAALDIEKIMPYYFLDTYSLSFDLPYKFDTGAGPHRQRLEHFLGLASSMSVTPAKDVEIWRSEGRVWTTRAFKAAGTLKNGDTFTFDGTYSAIWEQRGAQWGIVYEHFWGNPTLVAAAPPPPPVVAPAPATTPPPPPQLEDDDLQDVYFDFDRWNIRADQVATLTANALLLKQHPGVMVTVEGHCDERGSLGYNRALGQKRADETVRYLVSLGIEASRLQAVSQGKEHPFVAGRGESVWRHNRRSHFVIVRQ